MEDGIKNLSSKRAKALAIDTKTKRMVYARDGGLCINCRRPGLPEAHFIPRSLGGLGCEENIITLCRRCHDIYDNGCREGREEMKGRFAEYLSSCYDGWDEERLIYRKD